MYKYEDLKSTVQTDKGQRRLLEIRDFVFRQLESSVAVTMGKAMSPPGVSGDSWKQMACVDKLVELDEIREVIQPGFVRGQDRIFVKKG